MSRQHCMYTVCWCSLLRRYSLLIVHSIPEYTTVYHSIPEYVPVHHCMYTVCWCLLLGKYLTSSSGSLFTMGPLHCDGLRGLRGELGDTLPPSSSFFSSITASCLVPSKGSSWDQLLGGLAGTAPELTWSRPASVDCSHFAAASSCSNPCHKRFTFPPPIGRRRGASLVFSSTSISSCCESRLGTPALE